MEYGTQQNGRKKNRSKFISPIHLFLCQKIPSTLANSHIVNILTSIKSFISYVNKLIFPNNLLGASSEQLRFLEDGSVVIRVLLKSNRALSPRDEATNDEVSVTATFTSLHD